MHPAAQSFLSMPPAAKRLVHVRLCEQALGVWERHLPPGTDITYRESVAGSSQELDVLLPHEALASIRRGKDDFGISQRFQEPLAALHDGDLEIPEEAEFAFYAIHNAFQLYVVDEPTDDWLIVNQALSAIGVARAVAALQEAIENEA